MSILDNFKGQTRKNAISVIEAEKYCPMENSKKFPLTTASGREKTLKSGRETFARKKI